MKGERREGGGNVRWGTEREWREVTCAQQGENSI